MTTEVLKQTTARYLCGQSNPDEKDQIQTWLSVTGEKKQTISVEERIIVENEIIGQVNAYVQSTMIVTENKPWWKKVTTFF